jgi:hypothetical protein
MDSFSAFRGRGIGRGEKSGACRSTPLRTDYDFRAEEGLGVAAGVPAPEVDDAVGVKDHPKFPPVDHLKFPPSSGCFSPLV